VFLIGDAAGFLDPLTGDGMTAGFVAAGKLSHLLINEADASAAYRHWEAKQWQRRLFMGRLALALTNTAALGRRAIRGLSKRPVALDRLLEVNEGSRSLRSLSPRDWAALGGF
jgi:flavin-dependent dehydrogenase